MGFRTLTGERCSKPKVFKPLEDGAYEFPYPYGFEVFLTPPSVALENTGLYWQFASEIGFWTANRVNQ